MHSGASRGKAADERRLSADRGHWRLVQVVHLSGQHPGDAAGEEQGQVCCGAFGIGSGLAERGDQHNRGAGVVPAQRGDVTTGFQQRGGAALGDDQVRVSKRGRC